MSCSCTLQVLKFACPGFLLFLWSRGTRRRHRGVRIRFNSGLLRLWFHRNYTEDLSPIILAGFSRSFCVACVRLLMVLPGNILTSSLFWLWYVPFSQRYLSSAYFEPRDMTMIIGSFGASAVLVYAAIKSPLSQPRNLIGGHILSGLAGVLCYQVFGKVIWAAAALALSLSIALMLATKTLHPTGGATALIAVIGSEQIHNLGFLYAFVPAGLGAFILLIVALLVNNLSRNRKYPEYWF